MQDRRNDSDTSSQWTFWKMYGYVGGMEWMDSLRLIMKSTVLPIGCMEEIAFQEWVHDVGVRPTAAVCNNSQFMILDQSDFLFPSKQQQQYHSTTKLL